MLAFHNSPEIKARYLARVAAHRAADEIVQGVGFERNGKVRGCAVGCTLDRYDHAAYESELGIPVVLAHLEDRIHENLPLAEAIDWPGRFLAAPRPGADLSDVWPEFAIWLLTDSTFGVLQHGCTDDARAAIQHIADLYRERVPVGDPRWLDARRAAADAAAAAAAAAAAYAADAAYAAAYAAARSQARALLNAELERRLWAMPEASGFERASMSR